jgi:hypothetical protein
MQSIDTKSGRKLPQGAGPANRASANIFATQSTFIPAIPSQIGLPDREA